MSSEEKSNFDKVVKEEKKRGIIRVLVFMLLVCFCGYLGYMVVDAGRKISNYHGQSLKDSKEITKKTSDLQESQSSLTFKTQELEKLKKRLGQIKDKNDLMKRDIQLYIDTTHPKVPDVVAREIANQVVDLSRKYKISPELVVGIIKVESAFNPMAVGPKTKYGHARGLMQVMPEWAKKFDLEGQYEFHNIDVAIESGIKVFLIHLEEGKGDISTGLYYYVNRDKKYVGDVYAAMGKFVAYRSTIDEDSQNVETDIDLNGDSKKLPQDKPKPKKAKVSK